MRRAWLFVRDLADELRCAWGMARYRDCSRLGHRWLQPADDEVLGWSTTCARCGCGQSLERPVAATTATATTMTFDVAKGEWQA